MATLSQLSIALPELQEPSLGVLNSRYGHYQYYNTHSSDMRPVIPGLISQDILVSCLAEGGIPNMLFVIISGTLELKTCYHF